MRLKDKIAIVTGGGSGFGEGIVRKFVAEGARVVVADRDQVAAERVAGALGGKAIAAVADISTESGLRPLRKSPSGFRRTRYNINKPESVNAATARNGTYDCSTNSQRQMKSTITAPRPRAQESSEIGVAQCSLMARQSATELHGQCIEGGPTAREPGVEMRGSNRVNAINPSPRKTS